MGHPVLRAKALPVPVGQIRSAGVQQLIDDMFETMREYTGIGLAAPQVHEGLRIFVAGVAPEPVDEPVGATRRGRHDDRASESAESDDRVSESAQDEEDDKMPLMTVINPVVTPVGEAMSDGWEGCLSIPDIRGLVPRATHVRVEAYDRMGKKVSFTASGLAARVIQHETDHLDGVLFMDRMRSLHSLAFMEEYRRFWTEDHE